MNTQQKAQVEKAILKITDAYFEVCRQLDAGEFMSFFADAAGLFVVENGVIYPSRKAFYDEYIAGFFAEAVKLNPVWEERHVFPFSLEAAMVTGIFRYDALLRSGDAVGGRNACTFVFTKVGERWQIIHVHESSILAE